MNIAGFLISFENVGTLTSTTKYYITVKLMLPYMASPADMSSDFGTITVYSFHEGAYDVTPLIVGGRDATAVYSTKIYTSIAN